jgi:phage-related protein
VNGFWDCRPKTAIRLEKTFRKSNSGGRSGVHIVLRWGNGLWEVRSDLSSNRIGRVIFCMGEGHMILLHGFIKKTQKTPQQDIDLALKRKR